MSAITTWGEIDDSWIGRKVLVRWEDGTEPLFDGGPSGMPHEWRGFIRQDGTRFFLSTHSLEREPSDVVFVEQITDGFPEHAHVTELEE